MWFGATFPWLNVLAVRSAALRGGFARVILHHDSDLSTTAHFAELVATPNVALRKLDLGAVFANTGVYATPLAEVFQRLHKPATRSDLVRLALLYAEGGVYLDLDTVTLRSVGSLGTNVEAFCGEERIVLPARVRQSKNPPTRIKVFARTQLRTILRLAPRGWAAFRTVEHWYPAAVNNAVLGSVAGGRAITRLLERLLELPEAGQTPLYAIGPHLLQTVREELPRDALVVHEPSVFYPLGPEICEHWFRPTSASALDRVIGPETRVVHWYNSGRTRRLVPEIDPDYVRAHASRQLFSALALPFLR